MSQETADPSRQSQPHINLYVNDETSPLEAVVLGIAQDMGDPLDINPVSKYHIDNGTYPTEENLKREIATFENVLKSEGIAVYRPETLSKVDQIFTRDIGFVIEDKFVVANMLESVRQIELPAIQYILDQVDPDKILRAPAAARIEGGDVILYGDYIFVGISLRSNRAGYEFLKSAFPHKKVYALPLVTSDDPDRHVLHLDCTFQPVGDSHAIIYHAGFKQKPEILYSLFAQDKLIEVTLDEKTRMFPNVFSIGPKKVVIERTFTALKTALEERGFTVFEVDYTETSKLSGLLRCSTLPLRRSRKK
jgi:N-dimethylarginine dimethylaminohydrolase